MLDIILKIYFMSNHKYKIKCVIIYYLTAHKMKGATKV